eukprot:scaffold599_cov180-Amphora_coffeaeformis.AAC.1
MLLNPPRNDRMPRTRSERFLKEHPPTAAMQQASAAALSNVSTDVDDSVGDGEDHHHRHSHRRSLASSRSRSSRRLGLGRAKSMRHVRQSSMKKVVDSLSVSGHEVPPELTPEHRHHDMESSLKLEHPSHHHHHHRRKSKSKRDLLAASSHSKEDHAARSNDHGRSGNDDLDDLPTFSKSSLHEKKDRRAMMRKAQSTRVGMESTKSSHDDLFSSKSSHGNPISGTGRPKFTRRSSLSNFANKVRNKSEGKEEQTAALTHMMSKPKATGPYEGVALIQCDLQVHGGA